MVDTVESEIERNRNIFTMIMIDAVYLVVLILIINLITLVEMLTTKD